MLATLDLRGGSRKASDLRNLVPRAKFDLDSVVEQVRPIIEDVRERGVAAVQDWSEKFDGVRAPGLADLGPGQPHSRRHRGVPHIP